MSGTDESDGIMSSQVDCKQISRNMKNYSVIRLYPKSIPVLLEKWLEEWYIFKSSEGQKRISFLILGNTIVHSAVGNVVGLKCQSKDVKKLSK